VVFTVVFHVIQQRRGISHAGFDTGIGISNDLYVSGTESESEVDDPLLKNADFLHGRSLMTLRRIYLAKVGIYDPGHVHPVQVLF
jgi:hypothetical protein